MLTGLKASAPEEKAQSLELPIVPFLGPVEELHKIYSDFQKRVMEKESTLRDVRHILSCLYM